MHETIKRYKELNGTSGRKWPSDAFLYIFPWSPLFPLAVHRFANRIDKWSPVKGHPIRRILKLFYYVGRYFSVIFRKTQIEEDAVIQDGVWLSPKGNIILGPKTMGSGCLIHHNVTIGFGFGSGKKMERPHIGENVWIGPNVSIYGNIKIGNGAVICPGTVVNRNIPSNVAVKGSPLKLVKKDQNNSTLLKTDSTDAYRTLLGIEAQNA